MTHLVHQLAPHTLLDSNTARVDGVLALVTHVRRLVRRCCVATVVVCDVGGSGLRDWTVSVVCMVLVVASDDVIVLPVGNRFMLALRGDVFLDYFEQ